MESKKTFGDFIAMKRKQAGFTQKGFAEKLFITESAVSKWERGVSYPDISLIKDICEVLGVSEHELLTASEDTQTRANEKLAQRYMRMVQRFKIAQVVLYGIALVACFVCNLAIQHTLSWFFIVLASLLVAASLTLLPVYVKEKRRLAMLGGFTLSLLLCSLYTGGTWFVVVALSVLFGHSACFLPGVLRSIWLPEPFSGHRALLCMAIDTLLLIALLSVASSFSGGGWFFRQGLPIAGFWLVIPWGMLLIIRYLKINRLLKTAACIGLVDIVFTLSHGFTNFIVYKNTAQFGFSFDLGEWNMDIMDRNIRVLAAFGLAALALVFAVAGFVTAMKKQTKGLEGLE